jgi:hypothetical protein
LGHTQSHNSNYTSHPRNCTLTKWWNQRCLEMDYSQNVKSSWEWCESIQSNHSPYSSCFWSLRHINRWLYATHHSFNCTLSFFRASPLLIIKTTN